MDVPSLRTVLTQISGLVKQLTLRSDYFQKCRTAIITHFKKEKNNKFSVGMSWVNGKDFKIRSSVMDLLCINDDHFAPILKLFHQGS